MFVWASKSQYKRWTAKYGYGRFFPVYVDKSGFADDSPAPKAVSRANQIKAKQTDANQIKANQSHATQANPSTS